MNNININISTKKNLLAFSGGVDSSALFFILLNNNIEFDLAIVDYNQREQSKDEVIYATQLAHKYNKKCFISTYPLDIKFCEKDARDFRYNFFDQIINENSYESLITAHQLNDKLEWFLMQLTKGAGLVELIGLEEQSIRNSYQLHKPLLNYSKNDLLEYLQSNNIKYFIDSTNTDQKYKRNYFRANFSDKLINKYQDGIKKSFDYLSLDKKSLFKNVTIKYFQQLTVCKFDGDLNIAIRVIDNDLKKRGIVISNSTRDEIMIKKLVTISHKISVAIVDNIIFIAPYIQEKMEKKFKERCRIKKIPQNIRGYLSSTNIDLNILPIL